MSDLRRRPRSGLSRGARQRRAYNLVLGGAVATVATVVTLVLAIAGVVTFGVPVIALLVALLCAWMFRRTVAG
jgi:hypothetical protein